MESQEDWSGRVSCSWSRPETCYLKVFTALWFMQKWIWFLDQVRHQIKMNMFKAGSWEPFQMPLLPPGVVMKEENFGGVLQVPVPPHPRQGVKMALLHPKASGGPLSPLSELDVSPSSWVDKGIIHTWRNIKLVFWSGGGSEGGAAMAVGTSSWNLWRQRVHEHPQDLMRPHHRKGWPCLQEPLEKWRLSIQMMVTHVCSPRDISHGPLIHTLYSIKTKRKE